MGKPQYCGTPVIIKVIVRQPATFRKGRRFHKPSSRSAIPIESPVAVNSITKLGDFTINYDNTSSPGGFYITLRKLPNRILCIFVIIELADVQNRAYRDRLGSANNSIITYHCEQIMRNHAMIP